MKVIKYDEFYRGISPLYLGSKFPLFIYHSTQELRENSPDAKVIYNVSELAEWIKGKGYTDVAKSYSTFDDNVWLATNEVYVPDKYIKSAILYYTDEQGNPIKTDNCYVQLVGLRGKNNITVVATSSGLFYVGLFQPWVSAAVKEDFNSAATLARGKETAASARTTALKRNRATAADLRFVYYFLFPNSPYSDLYSAAKAAYGSCATRSFVNDLLKTDRIKKLILREVTKVIPDFQQILEKVYPKEEMAQDMKTMVKKTLEISSDKYNVDATRKALAVIIKLLDMPTQIGAMQEIPLIPGTQPKMVSEGEQKVNPLNKDIYEDEFATPNLVAQTGNPAKKRVKPIFDEGNIEEIEE